ARRPVAIVWSSGVKRAGTGCYALPRPETTLSFRSTSTSNAERGAMLPVSASSRQVLSAAVDSTVSVTLVRPPGHEVEVHRSTEDSPHSRPKADGWGARRSYADALGRAAISSHR